MRILEGTAKHMRIKTNPQMQSLRDQVRKKLFQHIDIPYGDGVVLDLFAGSGILGIEALSRGMKQCTFVDSSQTACNLIQQNLQTIGFHDKGVCLVEDVIQALKHLSKQSKGFDLILIDIPFNLTQLSKQGKRFSIDFVYPPFSQTQIAFMMRLLADSTLVNENGKVIVNHSMHMKLKEIYGLLRRSEQISFKRFKCSIYDRVALSRLLWK